jgi:pSer/pThr/pTyr-binding forkhead associated (FHA) protein
VIPYTKFMSQYGSLARDQFLEAIQDPYVLITLGAVAQDAGFQTVKFTKEAAVTESGERKGSMVLPVRKRPNANAFGMMITIGRATNNDLVIDHQKISKFHAYFRQVGTKWRICDANSRNGTAIGGIPVESGQEGLPVNSGSQIKLGKAVSLVFLAPIDLFLRLSADRR